MKRKEIKTKFEKEHRGRVKSTVNYYERLGIDRNATAEEVKRAFMRSTKGGLNETNPDTFMELKTIYELLMDEGSRRRYDEELLLGPERIRMLGKLEEEMSRNGDDWSWEELIRLEPYLLKSERVGAVLLEGAWITERYAKGIIFGNRLKEAGRMTPDLRRHWIYLLRGEKRFDEAITELKMLLFETDEKALEDILFYGRTLMQSSRETEANERFERWMLTHADRRIAIWKEWMGAIIFWGSKEQLEIPMRWPEARFDQYEEGQVKISLNHLFEDALHYKRYDSAYFLLDSCEKWFDPQIDAEQMTFIRNIGEILEELDVAYKASTIPAEFFYPAHELAETIKIGGDLEKGSYDDALRYLAGWLNEEPSRMRHVDRFKLFFPKCYTAMQQDYDHVFDSVSGGRRR